jgi:asparagine synthase (glutamine-hydrolysing)
VRTALNLPLSYRLSGPTDKWVLKKIAARYLPHRIVYRPKVGFPLPVKDYLAPLATPALFRDGFCQNVLGLHRAGFMEAISGWERNVHGFFNLLALEIWGRLFVLGQSVDELSEQVHRATGKAA